MRPRMGAFERPWWCARPPPRQADGSSGNGAITHGCKANVFAGERARGPDCRRGDQQCVAAQRASMMLMRGRSRRLEGAPDCCW